VNGLGRFKDDAVVMVIFGISASFAPEVDVSKAAEENKPTHSSMGPS
jgi:hypothetical protein